eukprot:jgi/Ulvmu1/6902/UM031_0109.1
MASARERASSCMQRSVGGRVAFGADRRPVAVPRCPVRRGPNPRIHAIHTSTATRVVPRGAARSVDPSEAVPRGAARSGDPTEAVPRGVAPSTIRTAARRSPAATAIPGGGANETREENGGVGPRDRARPVQERARVERPRARSRVQVA